MPQSTGLQRVGNDLSDPACIDTRLFFACGSSSPVRVECEGGAAAWVTGSWTVSTAGVMVLSESFFEPLVASDQKASLPSLSL